MKLLLRNFYIIDGSMEKARRADVLVDGGLIKEIAEPYGLSVENCETVDGKGEKLIIPGFFNAHCHAAMTLLRGLGEERPLMEWLEQKIWPLEAHLTKAAVYAGTMQAIAEMALGGVSGFTDMYYFMDQVARAVNETGVRCSVSFGVVRDPEKFKASLYRDITPLSGPKIINSIDPHAPYTVPFDFICQTAAEATRRGLPLQTHFLEAPWERGYFKDTIKMTPIEYLEKTGLVKVPHLVLAHCVQFTQEEVEYLAAHPNITAVHCPASNLKLGSGVAPVPDMLAAGAHVALGTDGASSNNRLDMWGEMRLTSLIHKGVRHDPQSLTARQILTMATYEGAQAFGYEKVGMLRTGWAADLTLVDIASPNYLGADDENMAAYLIYAGSSADVLSVLCSGEWIVRDRKFLPRPMGQIITESAKQRNWLISQRS